MYRLRDFLTNVLNMEPEQIVSDELFCINCDAKTTLLANQMHSTLDCYTFTLVTQGWMTLSYNGKELTFGPGDLYSYVPGLAFTIASVSENHHSICLLADKQLVFEKPIIRNAIRAAYFPLVELNEPKLHLSPENAQHLKSRMELAIDCLNSNAPFLSESLRAVYTLFLLDVMNLMEQSKRNHVISERKENTFINFIHLLPQNFTQHHDVAFYADKLNITTTHLSRIVRQLSGRTVVDYINQLLMMEASWLLQSTDLSISDIAEQLNFSDQSSFGRFFTRMKGIPPKTYRMRQ